MSWARAGGGGGAGAGRVEGAGEGIGFAWPFFGRPDCDLGCRGPRAKVQSPRQRYLYFLFFKKSLPRTTN